MIQWFKFWKTWRNGGSCEGYAHYNTYTDDEEEMKSRSKAWAEKHGGGQNYGFEWGYEKVDHPPKHWLDGQIGIAEQKKEGWENEIVFLHQERDKLRNIKGRAK